MRTTHKTQLKNILETITFESLPLSVNSYYTNVADRYPYCFITSGDMNIGLLQSRDYEEKRKYNINVVFALGNDNSITESRMDTLEGLIVDQLKQQSTRDIVQEQDIQLISVSSPYQDDITASDNCVIKTFEIEITTISLYA